MYSGLRQSEISDVVCLPLLVLILEYIVCSIYAHLEFMIDNIWVSGCNQTGDITVALEVCVAKFMATCVSGVNVDNIV